VWSPHRKSGNPRAHDGLYTDSVDKLVRKRGNRFKALDLTTNFSFAREKGDLQLAAASVLSARALYVRSKREARRSRFCWAVRISTF